MKTWDEFLVVVLVLVCSLVFQPGCGGSKPPEEEKSPAGKNSSASSKSEKAPAVKFDSLNLPKDLLKDLTGNIKDWAAKKGHSIQREKNGKVVIISKKGKKVHVPASVFPPNDKLSKTAADMLEGRLKEWADKKGYSTGLDKKGHLVGKSQKGKNVTPPLEIFLSALPEDLGIGTASAPAVIASGSQETTSDSGEDTDSDE